MFSIHLKLVLGIWDAHRLRAWTSSAWSIEHSYVPCSRVVFVSDLSVCLHRRAPGIFRPCCRCHRPDDLDADALRFSGLHCCLILFKVSDFIILELDLGFPDLHRQSRCSRDSRASARTVKIELLRMTESLKTFAKHQNRALENFRIARDVANRRGQSQKVKPDA